MRLNALLCVCGLQAWMMWNFTTFHLRRMREKAVQAKPRYSLRSHVGVDGRVSRGSGEAVVLSVSYVLLGSAVPVPFCEAEIDEK